MAPGAWETTPDATGKVVTPVDTGTQDANAQEPNKPNPVVQGLLAKLGKPTQPPASAAGAAVGVTEVAGRASDVQKPHSESSSGEVETHVFDVEKPQKPTPEATATHSLEVDCRYCGGCCGNRRGRRLPRRVYDFVAWVAGVRGVAMCQVVNEYPELFCRGLKRGRRHGLNRVKELERLLSREGQYKASYVLERLNECSNDATCWRYLRFGVEGWYRVVHLLANREPGDVEAYFSGLVRGLGFSGVVEFSRYLRLVDQGLVDFNYVNRGRGYRDVLSVRCRICGRVIDVTGPLPGVLFTIVNHFRVEHGLAGPEDVEAKVKELRERGAEKPEGDVGVKLLRHSGEVNQLIRLVVHRLVDRGLFERFGKVYRCRACNGDVGDAIDALVHVLRHHYDVISKLLGGRPAPSVDGFNDAVDELANLLNHGNPDAVKPTVKALVKGILEVLNVRGSISIPMLTRWLNEDDDYKFLLNSLTTSNMKADRLVVMIVDALARHGIIQVDGEVVSLGE